MNRELIENMSIKLDLVLSLIISSSIHLWDILERRKYLPQNLSTQFIRRVSKWSSVIQYLLPTLANWVPRLFKQLIRLLSKLSSIWLPWDTPWILISDSLEYKLMIETLDIPMITLSLTLSMIRALNWRWENQISQPTNTGLPLTKINGTNQHSTHYWRDLMPDKFKITMKNLWL